jgi:hypothetical protein
VALASREVVVIVVEVGVEATVRRRDAGDVIKGGIQRCSGYKVRSPIGSRFNSGEEVGGRRAAVGWL